VQKAYNELKRILRSRLEIVHISELSDFEQETVMRWIFRNEDKVWRDRGGRPKEETLAAFLNLLKKPILQPQENGSSTIVGGTMGESLKIKSKPISDKHFLPGLLAITGNPNANPNISKINDESIAGYMIGEFESGNKYEVITVWVDKKYKGMNLAVKLYENIFENLYNLDCEYLECDVIEGALPRMINSSLITQKIHSLGMMKIAFPKIEASYQQETSAHTAENFQKIFVRVKVIVWCMQFLRWGGKMRARFRDLPFLIGKMIGLVGRKKSFHYGIIVCVIIGVLLKIRKSKYIR